MDSRRGSNACSQSSLSSSASSITAARDLWRLRQTMHCLEQCNFYHGNLNRNEARERMRRCRPGTIKITFEKLSVESEVPDYRHFSVL